MQGHLNVSEGLYKFLTSLKRFLESTQLNVKEFLGNFQTINKNQLSQLQFFRIVSLLNMDAHSGFNPQQVFSELSKQNVTIDMDFFIKLFQSYGFLIIQKKGNQERSNEDQIRLNIGKTGIHKLVKFMRQHKSALDSLAQFDGDHNGALDKTQFSSFLLATDIKEFNSKQIRKIVVENIYKHFKPANSIPIKQFAVLFKLQEKQQPTVNIPPKINPVIPPVPQNISPLRRQNSSEKKPTQPYARKQSPHRHPHIPFPNSENIADPFAKKKENPYLDPRNILPPNPNVNVQKKQSYEQINNSKENYPHAIQYYRFYDPSPSECEVMQILEDLLTQNKRFIDNKNPIITEGVYAPAQDIFNSRYYLFQMAASIMMREKSRIGIARQIQPKDIIQGQVGDCYFLSSIASVVSIYAEIIADRFMFDINPANFYAVKLFIDGEWKIITTDNRFACRGGSAVYAKPHSQQIWVMLLQKCWAKVFGSYKAIQAGSSKQGFTALTGAPCELISHQKQEQQTELITKLEYAQANRYVATMSGSEYLESLGKRGEQQLGLISAHAYSLLKIIKFNNQTLVKLRNPWGKTIWKGNWSFSSPLWTKQLRDKYNYNNNPDDGSFYMDWRDFCRYFGEVVICKINPTYMHQSIRLKTNKRKSAYLQMRVRNAGHYIVSIYQQNKRKYSNMQNYEYSQSRLIILQKVGNQYHYIGAKACSQSQVCSVDVKLEEGDYIISAKVVWKFWNDHELVITSYGVDKTAFSLVDRSIAPTFKQNMIQSYANQFKGTGKVKNYQKFGFNATCETNFSIDTGIGYLRFVNNSAKGFESAQQMTSKGIKIIKPETLPLKFLVTPKYQRVVGFFVSPAGYEYSSSEKIKYY